MMRMGCPKSPVSGSSSNSLTVVRNSIFSIFFPGLLVVVMIKTTVLSDCVTCQDDFYFRKWPVSPAGIIRTGQSVELECRVSAEDRISISWTLNGQLLINSSRRYQNSTTGALVIRRADHRLDSGDFACTATNVSSGFSIASQLATLMIHCKLLLLFNHNQLRPPPTPIYFVCVIPKSV